MSFRFLRTLTLGATLGLLTPQTAHAQTQAGGIALNQLDPAPAGDRFFGLPSPYALGHITVRGALLFDYAHRPFVVEASGTTGAIVSAQAFMHAGASLALWDRLLVHVNVPVAIFQKGDNPTLSGIVFTSPSGAGIGDLRLGTRVRLYGENEGAFQLATGVAVHLPTGGSNGFVGEGGVRLVPEFIAGGNAFGLAWTAVARPIFRTSDNPAAIQYGAGVALRVRDRMQFGPEFQASTPIQEGFLRLSENKAVSRGRGTNAEILLGARFRMISDLWAGVGVGAGLGSAIGTPTFRALAMLSYNPGAKPKTDEASKTPTDTDEDGLLDQQDPCPYAFGKEKGCPLADRDEDTIDDKIDACPDEAGQDEKKKGCPSDKDEDNVQDSLDQCPNTKGIPTKNGC